MKKFLSNYHLGTMISKYVKQQLNEKEDLMEPINDTEPVKDVWYEGTTYTVNFYNYDGTLISTQQILYKQSAILPDDPIKPDDDYRYTFSHWDKDTSKVTSDLEVYPVFTRDAFLIAPEGELNKWEYRINGLTVSLLRYIGNDENVVMYDSYVLSGTRYNTKLKSISSMFYRTSIKTITFGKYIDTSSLNNTVNMFQNCTSLTSVDLTNFDTSNVDNMEYMFTECTNLREIKGLNTSNAKKMTYMFQNCTSLTSVDLSNFDVSNVTSLNCLFKGCSSLESLDLSNWNLSNLTSISYLFANCSSLTSLDLSNWKIPKLTYLTRLVDGCINLKEIKGLETWDTSTVTRFDSTFINGSSLTSLDLTSWNTSNAASMTYIFRECPNLKEIKVSRSKWIIKEGCDTTSMFYKCGVDHVTYVD